MWGKSTLLHWWTSATSKSTSTSRRMFARAISSVEYENLNWDNHLTKWLTVVINEKVREWIQNHPPVQVPSLNISECQKWILISRGLWITVLYCAKRKKTSIICVANLHSLLWNITSKAHKIRTTLKRRWIFKRASGNRCHHDAGKTPPPRQAATAAAAAAAIPCQYIRGQSPTTEKKKDSSRGQNLDYDSWMTYVEKTLFKRHRDESGKRRSGKISRYHTSSIVNGAVYKIPIVTGKRIHVKGLVALPLPQKLQICKLGDFRAIRRP